VLWLLLVLLWLLWLLLLGLLVAVGFARTQAAGGAGAVATARRH
jgi:hypothetical protein